MASNELDPSCLCLHRISSATIERRNGTRSSVSDSYQRATQSSQDEAAELRYNGGKTQQEALDRFGIKRPLRYLMFPGRTEHALASHWFGPTGPEHSGLYRLRFQASGIQATRWSAGAFEHWKNRPAKRTVEGLIEFDITASGPTQVYEGECIWRCPASLHFCVVATNVIDRRGGAAFRNALSCHEHIFTHISETQLLNPNAPQMFDEKGNGIFSTVILDWIEWEGPLTTDSERSRREGVLRPKKPLTKSCGSICIASRNVHAATVADAD